MHSTSGNTQPFSATSLRFASAARMLATFTETVAAQIPHPFDPLLLLRPLPGRRHVHPQSYRSCPQLSAIRVPPSKRPSTGCQSNIGANIIAVLARLPIWGGSTENLVNVGLPNS